jgi:beta-1,2-mannobiose phosphorylase / 1,2-beta-oligomannan phosphorylase
MDNNVLLFFVILLVVGITLFVLRKEGKRTPPKTKEYFLTKHGGNPIASPQSHNEWEACGVFNSGAYIDETDTVHLLYRAVGSDGISRVGYAKSEDGFSITERIPYPVFFLENIRIRNHFFYDPKQFPSGGSWGGAEDPRIVEIDGRLYLTFNAFDGWDFIRIGVTSIAKEDFLAGRWNWSKTRIISPEDQLHKNWILFPEKINGKFAILHSISPDVLVDYRESLDAIGNEEAHIESPTGPRTAVREGVWDYKLRGAGSPPIKTDKGWLVLYHATEKQESYKYKIGALLLDLNDPQKIIARSPAPVLAPDCWYEDDEKPGIVYTCGAVIRGEMLLIYYGGGDKHLCVAETKLSDLLDWMISTENNSPSA